MKTPLLATLFWAGLSAAANAAPPIYSEEESTPPQMAPAPVPVVPQAQQQQPLYFNGPVYVIPAWPAAPPVPTLAPATPPVYRTQPPMRTATATERPKTLARRFGLGGRPAGMWINQQLYNSYMLLVGGGAQARLRLTDRFALEATLDVLQRNIHEGVFERTSYPIQLGGLFYAMPPRPGTHFAVYGALGGGVMPSRITLDDRNVPRQELKATEAIGQVGVGCELHLWRFSINADARAVGMYRTGDDSYFDSFVRPDTGPNSLSLRQVAVLDKSYGWLFNIGAMFWL